MLCLTAFAAPRRKAGGEKFTTITVNGDWVRELELEDTLSPQFIDIGYTQHAIAKPVEIQIEVVDSYPGEVPEVCIMEIGAGLNSDLIQGR